MYKVKIQESVVTNFKDTQNDKIYNSIQKYQTDI